MHRVSWWWRIWKARTTAAAPSRPPWCATSSRRRRGWIRPRLLKLTKTWWLPATEEPQPRAATGSDLRPCLAQGGYEVILVDRGDHDPPPLAVVDRQPVDRQRGAGEGVVGRGDRGNLLDRDAPAKRAGVDPECLAIERAPRRRHAPQRQSRTHGHQTAGEQDRERIGHQGHEDKCSHTEDDGNHQQDDDPAIHFRGENPGHLAPPCR